MEQNRRKTRYSAYELAEIVNRWHQLWTHLEKRKIDYGTGDLYTSVEVHTVTHVEDNPGITVTQIAEDTLRTKSAVSQMVSKLEGKGLLRREQDAQNAKLQRLYVTEKGLELSRCHKLYDETNFPQEDIISLYGVDVVDKFIDVLRYITNRMIEKMRLEEEKSTKTQ